MADRPRQRQLLLRPSRRLTGRSLPLRARRGPWPCDGTVDRVDCAPSDPAVHSFATELCFDQVDNGCDGRPDLEDDGCIDADEDGAINAEDCAPLDPEVHPGADDRVGDTLDQNCDGMDGLDDDGDGYAANGGGARQDCDDGEPTAHPGGIEAEFDGIDQDCDGLDGDPEVAIFVATPGSVGGAGTRLDPVDTLQAAIDAAAAAGRSWVVVAEGTWSGSIELAADASVVGGWSSGFTAWQPEVYPTVVQGGPSTTQQPAALNLVRVAGEDQAIRGLTVLGPQATSPGASSYGVHATGCGAGVRFVHNTITARDGAHGAPGDPGDPGVDGGEDMHGKTVRRCGFSPRTGGDGGLSICAGGDRCGGEGDRSGGEGGGGGGLGGLGPGEMVPAGADGAVATTSW